MWYAGSVEVYGRQAGPDRSITKRKETEMRVQLTDRFCASAKSTGQTDYFDATVPGLALRVTGNGTKAWSLLHGTPRRRVTLGRYPSLSLAGARTRAIEVKDGRSSGTIAALTETYLRSINGLRSVREIERRLRRDVLPIIGHIPLAELHRRDVMRIPVIAPTRSDASRPPVPTDRDQCEGAVRCTC